MGWLKNVGLIAAGAAAGYLASRRSDQQRSKDLVQRPDGGTLDSFLAPEGTMAQFFDSKYGQPFQKAAVRTLKFMADVKSGMNEKEAEYKQKLEDQKKDLRPGSLDTWDRPSDAEHRIEADDSEVIEIESVPDIHEQLRQNRLRRDKDLGEDFFTA